jgi:hypothetical protein
MAIVGMGFLLGVGLEMGLVAWGAKLAGVGLDDLGRFEGGAGFVPFLDDLAERQRKSLGAEAAGLGGLFDDLAGFFVEGD